MTDAVAIFENYAASKGYRFAYGHEEILQWEISSKDLTGGEYLLLMFPFDERAIINGNVGVIGEWELSTQLWLGRKFDNTSTTGTKSSIDETTKQKYDRRLLAIREELATMIKDVFCTDTYELTAARIRREINISNESLDFVVAEISFKDSDNV
jgi:hypothetical protein